MRIISISDTHSLHRKMTYDVRSFLDPKQDNILIHAGDITNVGKEYDVSEFVYWFQNLNEFQTKIFIAGNHDLSFESEPSWLNNYINEENLSQSDCVYLEDEYFVISTPEFSRPLKFYGSPWQPEFMNWAFNLPRNGDLLKDKWNMIPEDTDILITHCPPFGIRDVHRKSLGCELLRERVDKLNLLANVFGHIHDGYGAAYIKDTLYINASVCTEQYSPINRPIVFDITESDGKLITTYITD